MADVIKSARTEALEYVKDVRASGINIENIEELISEFATQFKIADEDESLDVDYEELKKLIRKLVEAGTLAEDVPEVQLRQILAVIGTDPSKSLKFRGFLDFMLILKGIITEPMKKRPLPKRKLGREGAVVEKPRGSVHLEASVVDRGHDYEVKLTILAGRNLLAMDYGGKSDPYVKVVLTPQVPHGASATKQKTTVCKSTLNPVWNKLMSWSIPKHEDIKKYSLTVAVWDYDLCSRNDFMGCMSFSVSEIQAHPIGDWWLLLNEKLGLSHAYQDLMLADLTKSFKELHHAPSKAVKGALVAPRPAPPPRPPVPRGMEHDIKDYLLKKVLGCGSFGKVFLAEHKTLGHVGLKVVKKCHDGDEVDLKAMWAEHAVLSLTPPSPFVVRMLAAFQTNANLFFTLELLGGGDLYTLVTTKGPIAPRDAAFFVAEIVLALDYLHGHGIIHRDVKLDNLVMDLAGHVKLVDFGLCKALEDPVRGRTNTVCGTYTNMAPEIVRHLPYSFEIDWWSLGVVTYELLSGAMLFTGDTEEDVHRSILEQVISFSDIDANAVQLLHGFLERDPARRLGRGPGCLAAIQAQPFFVHDWTAIAERRVPPPFPPAEKDPAKCFLNFEDAFTSQNAEMTPVMASDLKKAAKLDFKDFAFVASEH